MAASADEEYIKSGVSNGLAAGMLKLAVLKSAQYSARSPRWPVAGTTIHTLAHTRFGSLSVDALPCWIVSYPIFQTCAFLLSRKNRHDVMSLVLEHLYSYGL